MSDVSKTNDLIAEARRQAAYLRGVSRDGSMPYSGELLESLVDALVSVRAERDAALARIAELEAKHPEGWSTEDRQAAYEQAALRWGDSADDPGTADYAAGAITGFILGAEWQKARETFISYKAIANEAEARIAEAAKLHRPDWSDWGIDHPEEGASCSCGANYSYDECPTRIALGLNEGEKDD